MTENGETLRSRQANVRENEQARSHFVPAKLRCILLYIVGLLSNVKQSIGRLLVLDVQF